MTASLSNPPWSNDIMRMINQAAKVTSIERTRVEAVLRTAVVAVAARVEIDVILRLRSRACIA